MVIYAINQLRDANPGKAGNIRDHATLKQLVVLSNMESLPGGRQVSMPTITQMKSLLESKAIKRLK